MSDGIISDRNAAAFLAEKDGARSQAALKRLCRLRYDPKVWVKAIEEHNITAKWFIGQLKSMILEGTGSQKLAALERLLNLIETLGLGWDKVGKHFGLDPKMADGLRGVGKSKASAELPEDDSDAQKKLDEPIAPLRFATGAD